MLGVVGHVAKKLVSCSEYVSGGSCWVCGLGFVVKTQRVLWHRELMSDAAKQRVEVFHHGKT
jgi:hypothetical protein